DSCRGQRYVLSDCNVRPVPDTTYQRGTLVNCEEGSSMRRLLLSAFALACVLALPTTARAQSAFAGVVKDATGAVLPGVTVEASSPALIEKVRSVTTDANGAYKIENLRPGTYTLTFNLPGFSTVKKDAIELQSNFTSTINAELKVGAMEETVTVSGESPVVDL